MNNHEIEKIKITIIKNNDKLKNNNVLRKLKDKDYKFELQQLYKIFFGVTGTPRNCSQNVFEQKILAWLQSHPVKKINDFSQCKENMFCLFTMHKLIREI